MWKENGRFFVVPLLLEIERAVYEFDTNRWVEYDWLNDDECWCCFGGVENEIGRNLASQLGWADEMLYDHDLALADEGIEVYKALEQDQHAEVLIVPLGGYVWADELKLPVRFGHRHRRDRKAWMKKRMPMMRWNP